MKSTNKMKRQKKNVREYKAEAVCFPWTDYVGEQKKKQDPLLISSLEF